MTFDTPNWTDDPANYSDRQFAKLSERTQSNSSPPSQCRLTRASLRETTSTLSHEAFVHVDGTLVLRPPQPLSKLSAEDEIPQWIMSALVISAVGLLLGFGCGIKELFYPAAIISILSMLSLVLALGRAKRLVEHQS
jgi:hypothetical protein